MKAPRIIWFFLLSFPICFSGCRSVCDADNRSEGFNKGMLRVYVRVNRQDIPGEYRDAGESYLMMISQRRAAELLESYFKANPGEADRDSFRLEKIPVIVKSGRLACNGCNDDYCEAFADFDAGAVKDIITK